MNFSRLFYRVSRPLITNAYSRILSSRILTRSELLDDPPAGHTLFLFGSDERYKFDRPIHVGKLPDAIEAKLGKCTVPSPFVVEVKDATAIGPSALVTTNGRILLESVRGSYPRLADASVRALLAGQIPLETRFQSPDRQYVQPIFSLVGPWVTEYYHWIADYLIRVFALEIYRERTGRDPLVLIPPNPPKWIVDSLSMVGIDIDRTIEWSGGIAHFSQLVIGSVRYHTASEYDGYIHSPAAMARLGDRIRTAVSSSSTGTRRIYVSRADAADRRILNESELMSVLNKYGFERIVPGSLSFEEQVQTFADAEIILGPHGAGLTNIIFADETTLVELFGSYQNACFFTLAQGVGHEYVSVMCRSNGSDMVVDVDTIEAVVDDVV